MSTHVFFLLDMTGSMSRNKEATIDACNEFIGAQQSNPGADDSVFTLGVFNSNIGLERIVREVSLDRAPRIDHEHYRPDGATPLYDAIGETMTLLESHTGPVLFIIQTDGEENSSRRVTREEVLAQVAEKTAAGWQFVYLGCDIEPAELAHEQRPASGERHAVRDAYGQPGEDDERSTGIPISFVECASCRGEKEA